MLRGSPAQSREEDRAHVALPLVLLYQALDMDASACRCGCRKWMTEVLQPLNERVAEIVTKNADLLEAAAMEPLLLQLVAHVSAYRVIIKRWAAETPSQPSAGPPRDGMGVSPAGSSGFGVCHVRSAAAGNESVVSSWLVAAKLKQPAGHGMQVGGGPHRGVEPDLVPGRHRGVGRVRVPAREGQAGAEGSGFWIACTRHLICCFPHNTFIAHEMHTHHHAWKPPVAPRGPHGCHSSDSVDFPS